MILRYRERYLMGGTIPGIPGVLAGRNNDLAWGVTYAFIDAQDSWIERCRDGRFYREDGNRWIEFHHRVEIIKRKNRAPVRIDCFENEHGILEGDPRQEGYYLATRWAPSESGVGALRASFGLLHADLVDRAMKLLGEVETAWNFVFADRHGNIGYQMSGLAPRRREGISGFVPLPGWKKENDWAGFVPAEDLPRAKNPPEGFFATANDDLNAHGRSTPINLPMGPYRGERIRHLLAARDNFGLEDMFTIQFDLHSRQAERFMNILKPLLPPGPRSEILRNWDFRYSNDSEGAWLFERFYEELYREAFGQGGLGPAAVDKIRKETGAFIDFYHNFDRVLLKENSVWFGGRSRNELFRQAAARALTTSPRRWGDLQRFRMTNIFFNGRLPGFLGFDRGPFSAQGGRATVHQAQIYQSGGRRTSFLPSFRFVADLALDELRTTLAGGPSDRRFSCHYASDVGNWLHGRYKILSGIPRPSA